MTTTELITLEGDKPIYASQLNDNFDLLDGKITDLTDSTSQSISSLSTLASGALPKSGGTMTGNLTISKSAPYIYLKNTAQTAGTTPGSTLYEKVDFTDKYGKSVGAVGNRYNTDGSRNSYLCSTDASGENALYIRVGYDVNGKVYTYAPTPLSNAHANTIATTGWVSGSMTKAANGSAKLPSGLIIEWATFTTTSDTYKTWTFKNSFTSGSSYAVVGTINDSGDVDWSPGVQYVSGSSCRVHINDATARFIAVGY